MKNYNLVIKKIDHCLHGFEKFLSLNKKDKLEIALLILNETIHDNLNVDSKNNTAKEKIFHLLKTAAVEVEHSDFLDALFRNLAESLIKLKQPIFSMFISETSLLSIRKEIIQDVGELAFSYSTNSELVLN